MVAGGRRNGQAGKDLPRICIPALQVEEVYQGQPGK